jgi:hypothetical protein
VQYGVQVYKECGLNLNRRPRCTVHSSCLGAPYVLEYIDCYKLNSPPFRESGRTFRPASFNGSFEGPKHRTLRHRHKNT